MPSLCEHEERVKRKCVTSRVIVHFDWSQPALICVTGHGADVLDVRRKSAALDCWHCEFESCRGYGC